MNNKEIILSKIAEILSRKGFFIKSNSEFKHPIFLLLKNGIIL